MKRITLWTFAAAMFAFVISAPRAGASTACDNAFRGGSLPYIVTICISNQGNVVGFAMRSRFTTQETWVPVDNIRVGVIGEGYAVCNVDTHAASFDAAFDQSGWGPATVTQSPLTVQRKTTDGKIQLTQVFSVDTRGREVLIAMSVTNLSGASVHLQLARYADFDVNASSGGDVFFRSRDSVFALDVDAMSLTGLMRSSSLAVLTTIEGKTDWGYTPGVGTHTGCWPIAQSGSIAGDYVARVTFDFTLAAGASKSMMVAYRGQ